jgi:hypothetical protein
VLKFEPGVLLFRQDHVRSVRFDSATKTGLTPVMSPFIFIRTCTPHTTNLAGPYRPHRTFDREPSQSYTVGDMPDSFGQLHCHPSADSNYALWRYVRPNAPTAIVLTQLLPDHSIDGFVAAKLAQASISERLNLSLPSSCRIDCDVPKTLGECKLIAPSADSKMKQGTWLAIPYCTPGEYTSHNSLHKANLECLTQILSEEDPEELCHYIKRGHYSTETLYIRDDYQGSCVPLVESLFRYPCINEELQSIFEEQSYQESLTSYLDQDFARELGISRECSERLIKRLTASGIDECLDLRNDSHEESGDSWHFPTLERSVHLPKLLHELFSTYHAKSFTFENNDYTSAKIRSKLGHYQLRYGKKVAYYKTLEALLADVL